jgi:hypothetical protein
VGNTHFSYFPFKAESQNLVEGRAFVIEPTGNILVDLMVWILALEECNLSIQVLGLLVCRNSGVDDVNLIVGWNNWRTCNDLWNVKPPLPCLSYPTTLYFTVSAPKLEGGIAAPKVISRHRCLDKWHV